MVFEAGLRVGKYVVGKPLGRGGFGTVFVARDTNLDRDVALKLLHPEHTHDPKIVHRFLQEARATAKIQHPGIVTIYETGTVDGTSSRADGSIYIAMELLYGESLTRRLDRSRRFAPEAAMEVCRQIASALDAAHAQGIIHRDLKPDNVYLVPDPAVPGGERVKVLDFGIAKLAADAHQSSSGHTSTMLVFGTPRYMSPEQCKSATKVDHRSDIYSLGCILFELVCGQPPFDGEPGELVAKQQLVAPPRAIELVPELPAGLDGLITMLLAKSADRRPQSMHAVERALAAGGAAAPSSTATEPPHRTGPRAADFPLIANPTTLSSATGVSRQIRRRNTVSMITIGSIAAVVTIVAVWIAVHARQPEVEERPAALPPPPPREKVAEVTPPPSRPPPQLTADKISQRIGLVFARDITACHLKLPASHGSLEVAITVDAAGDVTDKAAKGVDPELAACIEEAASTWTFFAEQGRPPIAAVWATKISAAKAVPLPDKVPDKVPDKLVDKQPEPTTPTPTTPTKDAHPPRRQPPPKRTIGNGTLDPFPESNGNH